MIRVTVAPRWFPLTISSTDAIVAKELLNGVLTRAALESLSGSTEMPLRDLFRPVGNDFDDGILTSEGLLLDTGIPASFSMTGAVATLWNAAPVRWLSGTPQEANPGTPADGCSTFTTGAENVQCTMSSFIYTGRHVMLSFVNYGVQAITVYIDNKIAYRGYPAAASVYYLSIPFVEFGTHQIEIHTGIGVVQNFWTHMGDTLVPGPERFVLGLDGDSYADIGQVPDYGGLALALFEETGFAVVGFAQGATGWVDQNDGGEPTKENYIGTNRNNAKLAVDPDLILVIGSINDTEDPVQVATNVGLYHAQLDGIPVITAGVEHYNNGTSGYANNNTAIIDSVEAIRDAGLNALGAIDWYTLAWQTGTGSSTAPAADGNQDHIIGADGVHPNLTGTRFFGALFAAAMGAINYRRAS